MEVKRLTVEQANGLVALEKASQIIKRELDRQFADPLLGHEVRIVQRYLTPSGKEGIILLDTLNLPPGVSRLDLQKLIPELVLATGLDIGIFAGTPKLQGFGYRVALRMKYEARLPKQILLDLDAIPAGDYTVPLGISENGPIYRPLGKLGHILIGGITRRAGKTNQVLVMLMALLTRYSPEELRIGVIDLKEVDYSPLAGVPHLETPIAHDLDSALSMVQHFMSEVNVRKGIFRDPIYAASLEEYNAYAAKHGMAQLPRLVLAIDEFVLLMTEYGECSAAFQDAVAKLVSSAAAFGITLVLVTQHPKAKIIDTVIRGECITRMAGHVAEAVHSRAILDQGGAENLPAIPGRMLLDIGGDLIEVQQFYLPREMLKEIVAKIKDNGPALSDAEVRLALCARDELSGFFSIPRLEAKLGPARDGGVSARRLRKIARAWERRGWLLPGPPDDPTQARRLSSSLLQRPELCGDARGRAGTQGQEVGGGERL